MRQISPPVPASPVRGAQSLHATIIACKTQDEGACIMCVLCGHVFVDSVPLSDESEEADNVNLAKSLYYHICALPKRPPRRNTSRRR